MGKFEIPWRKEKASGNTVNFNSAWCHRNLILMFKFLSYFLFTFQNNRWIEKKTINKNSKRFIMMNAKISVNLMFIFKVNLQWIKVQLKTMKKTSHKLKEILTSRYPNMFPEINYRISMNLQKMNLRCLSPLEMRILNCNHWK